MEGQSYPPHITLATYDEVDVADLFDAFDEAFKTLPKVKISFEALGYFEVPHAIVLWAAPNLPRSITAVHERIHTEIDVDLCRPYYRPGTWVPHCSLATAIDSSLRDAAIALSKRPIQPIEVEFDVADCASSMPVGVVREKLLRSAD